MNFYDRVKKTYAYGQVFGYKRSLPEIYFWLIGSKKTPLASFVKKMGPKIHLYNKRTTKSSNSKKKIALAKHLLKPLFYVPLISFLGVTGSVSANNAKKNDDIDIFIITSPHSLWITRPIVLFYLELKKVRRKRSTPATKQKDLICPNLWMDSLKLTIPNNKQNLYTAHELLQILPIFDKRSTHHSLVQKNLWAKKYLANAYIETVKKKTGFRSTNPLWFLLSPLNYLMYIVQLVYMYPFTNGESVSYTQAYFHDHKYSQDILSRV